jgi:predicted alpha-1,6-mannanase (GH76 family)
VALHRYVEGIIAVIRRYPIDPEQMRCDARSYARMLDQRKRVAAFMRRARDEGFLRADLPDGMAEGMLYRIVALLARQYPDYDSASAADIAVDLLLSGVGTR